MATAEATLARASLTGRGRRVRVRQAKNLTLVKRNIEPVRQKLQAKDLRLGTKVEDGAFKIVSGKPFFLKGFLKKEGFNWDPNEGLWLKAIQDDDTEETIDKDFHELAQEWGYTPFRVEYGVESREAEVTCMCACARPHL